MGKFAGVTPPEKVDQIVVMEPKLGGVFLSETPFAIATVSFPVGDVALRDMDAEFVEGSDWLNVVDGGCRRVMIGVT